MVLPKLCTTAQQFLTYNKSASRFTCSRDVGGIAGKLAEIVEHNNEQVFDVKNKFIPRINYDEFS